MSAPEIRAESDIPTTAAIAMPRPTLPFDPLPVDHPRTYVPADADLSDWARAEPLLEELEHRELCTVADLERWLLDVSELTTVFLEGHTRLHIATTLDTGNRELAEGFMAVMQELMPRWSPRAHRLARKYAACPLRSGLEPKRYGVLDRDLVNGVEMYREENTPLHLQEAMLGQEYLQKTGGLMIPFQGREHTFARMDDLQDEADRGLRESAWRATMGAFAADAAFYDAVFGKLLAVRRQVSANSGFAADEASGVGAYEAYSYRSKGRFDYGPGDSARLGESIRRVVAPLARRRAERRARLLGVERPRPWDLKVDPELRPPLKPFADYHELNSGVARILDAVDLEIGAQYRFLMDRRLLDVETRKGKMQGGYQVPLPESRMPFILSNGSGRDGDLVTLCHEMGHAAHTLFCRDEPLFEYRTPAIEFAEVASMSMELFATEHLGQVYDGEDLRAAREKRLERVLGTFLAVAKVDRFQKDLYLFPEAADAAWRRRRWLALGRDYDTGVDWSGLEDYEAASWFPILHVFQVPFYYVEYAIAQIGALQLWRDYRRDPAATIARYKAALKLGGGHPLPELFEAAGARLDFGEDLIKELVGEVEKALLD